MKLIAVAALLLAAVASPVLGAKPDLPSDAPLRIGVKHRVPEEECTRKSRNGDRLSMHYTGTLRVDDSQFDSSVGRAPFDFVIGVRIFDSLFHWLAHLCFFCFGFFGSLLAVGVECSRTNIMIYRIAFVLR